MQCIVVKQPWASLVVAEQTHYLIRTWRSRHRGRLAILASSRLPRQNVEFCCQDPLRGVLRDIGIDYVIQLPLGALVGAVTLCECKYVTEDNRHTFDLADPMTRLGILQPGSWAWICSAPEKYAIPLPALGRLGVFEIPTRGIK